jgi:hypothetical protein
MTVTKKSIIQKYVDIVYRKTNYSNHKSTMIIREGEIMKVGYTFACFMTKKIVFSQVIQLLTYKSIFFI